MRHLLLAVAVCAGSAVAGVRYLEFKEAQRDDALQMAENTATRSDNKAKAAYFSSTLRDEVRITRGAHNQFFVTARVNRQAAPFLVDTGASYVALRESDANRAGIFARQSDFTTPVRTANGETRAAFITVDIMEIDGIRVENVEAFILPDSQLDMNLLGMCFLSELTSVEARDGELILKS